MGAIVSPASAPTPASSPSISVSAAPSGVPSTAPSGAPCGRRLRGRLVAIFGHNIVIRVVRLLGACGECTSKLNYSADAPLTVTLSLNEWGLGGVGLALQLLLWCKCYDRFIERVQAQSPKGSITLLIRWPFLSRQRQGGVGSWELKCRGCAIAAR